VVVGTEPRVTRALLVAGCLVALGRIGYAAPPDVLVVLLDTVRADATSVYGGPPEATPHLARLAAEGVVAEHGLANGLWTFPTVATLLTGRSLSRHGVTNIATDPGLFHHRFSDALPDAEVTLAESFRTAGYRTGLFTSAGWYNGRHNLEQGFETVVSFEKLQESGTDAPFGIVCRRSDAEAFERALAFRKEAGESPVFAYVHVLGPHSPLDLPRDELGAFVTVDEYQRRLEEDGIGFGYKQAGHAKRLASDPAFRDFYRRLYLEVLRYTDRITGEFVARWLEARPDTIVLITADHGEALNDRHLEYLHGEGVTPLGPLVDIPLLFHAPARLAPQRISTPVTQADVAPTLLGLADIEDGGARIDGRNMATLLRDGGTGDPARVVMAEGGYTFLSYAVRRSPWELVRVHPSSRAAIWQINRINRSDHAETLQRVDRPGGGNQVGRRPRVASSLRGEAHRRLLARAGFHLLVRGSGRGRRFAGVLSADSPVDRVAIRAHHPGAAFDVGRIEALAPGLLRRGAIRHAVGGDVGVPVGGQPVRLVPGASVTFSVPPDALRGVPWGVAIPVRYGFASLSAGAAVRIRFASPGNRNVNKCHDRVRGPVASWFTRLCVADSGRALVLRLDNDGPEAVDVSGLFLLVEGVAADAVTRDGATLVFDFPLARGWVDIVSRHEGEVGRMSIEWKGATPVPTYVWTASGFRRVEGSTTLDAAALDAAEPRSGEDLLAALRSHHRGDDPAAYVYRFGRASNTETRVGGPDALAPEVVDHLEKLGYL
jgi:choline-sulfatase